MNRGAKLGLLGSLYFSQGLPFGFFTQALPLMLRKQGFSLSEIGLTSLLVMPWALKFLWAPLVDRRWSAALGRRRSWILPLQLAAALTLLALAQVPEVGGGALLMAAVVMLNLLAATQDIATDALAVDLVTPSERGLTNGLQVAGYRAGMIVGGGVLLILSDVLGTGGAFEAMAALIVIATVPVLLFRERPPTPAPTAAAPSTAVHFLKRPGAWGLIGLIVSFKFGDAFAAGMLRPFLADLGLTLPEVGWMLGTVGFVAGLFGALAGGALVNRLGRRRALLGFGLLQAVAVGQFVAVAAFNPGREWLTVVCGVEHFVGGMASAALFTCMMDWCSGESNGTDYTVQASAVVIATGVANVLSGFSAQAFGYLAHFSIATVLAVASMAVVARSFRMEPVATGRTEAVSCA